MENEKIKVYLKSIEDNYNKVNTKYSEEEILKQGYSSIGRFITGYDGYNGYNNEPREVFKRYSKNYYSIIFSINNMDNPFKIEYSAYGIEMDD